ncbi:Rha family transcriptional regulator [Mesorhizobium sp. Root172]|jgi:Rha family phage regulatory protein|uniref:Rha family transcriptional regulator n=1 Tax=Mesorhizobium sp. Root172 TaxID=1736481 RepID=UPI0009EC461C
MNDSAPTETQLTMFDAMKLLDFTDDRLFVNSLDVAERFEKQHNNVLRSIEALECSPEFRALNFERSSYSTAQNKNAPLYKMTRDGFSLLVRFFLNLCDSAAAFAPSSALVRLGHTWLASVF